MRSHISTASSMLCVTISTDLIGSRPSIQRSIRSVRSVSAVSTSSAENGSSISSRSGCTTSARAKPTRWRMPPDNSFGIGGLEAVEADQVDRGERPLAALGAIDPERLQSELDVLQHRQPGKQREGLEHHGDAVRRTDDGLAAAFRVARGRRDQAGDDAQQRRFAGAGAAEQADDLARADRQIDLFEHQQFLAAALRKGPADAADIDQGGLFGLIEHDVLLSQPRRRRRSPKA